MLRKEQKIIRKWITSKMQIMFWLTIYPLKSSACRHHGKTHQEENATPIFETLLIEKERK